MQFLPHPEGYVRATLLPSDDYAFSYVYQYKDHLGNIRLNYGYDPVDEQVEILNEDHYYPFGLKHLNYSSGKKDFKMESAQLQITSTPFGDENPYLYKYNSKEWQDELGLNWYDYRARNYDPAIGRFFNIDRLAEKYYNLASYQYTANNPVLFVDVQGDSIRVANVKDQARVLQMINSKAVG